MAAGWRWAVEEAAPADVLTTAPYALFRSRQTRTFGEKMLPAMRFGLGGHVEGAESVAPPAEAGSLTLPVARDDVERKDARSLLATKTAALNLSILAATQIHGLHIPLRDKVWRAASQGSRQAERCSPPNGC